MASVMGIGGFFFQCKDVDVTKEWYVRILGLSLNDYGGFDFLHEASAEKFKDGARTIFAPFAEDSDYFAPSKLPFMLNLMVDDLDGILEQAKAHGVEELQPSETYSYGRFAWIMDPDGRKIELWQPFGSEPDDTPPN